MYANKKTAKNNDRPDEIIASRPAPIMLATINTIKITAIKGANGNTFLIYLCLFKKIPIVIGKITTLKVLIKSPKVFTSTLFSANKVVKIGVITTANKVDIAVMETDKATFALAKKEITLEAVPPGQQATNINPTENGVDK